MRAPGGSGADYPTVTVLDVLPTRAEGEPVAPDAGLPVVGDAETGYGNAANTARSVRAYFQDTEARAVVVLLFASCAFIATYVWVHGGYASFWTSLRHVSFNLVSVALDSGFTSVDYAQWPIFAPLFMLFLSCITVRR